ncbi:MAG: hypothetical protein V3V05_13060 [Pontiella sp.]
MRKIINGALAMLIAVVLSGCAGAAFNKFDLTLNRNITVGQELLDLKVAHEEGVLNDTEYMEAKKNILNILNQLGEVNVK